jgi:hypothetical protein
MSFHTAPREHPNSFYLLFLVFYFYYFAVLRIDCRASHLLSKGCLAFSAWHFLVQFYSYLFDHSSVGDHFSFLLWQMTQLGITLYICYFWHERVYLWTRGNVHLSFQWIIANSSSTTMRKCLLICQILLTSATISDWESHVVYGHRPVRVFIHTEDNGHRS